MDKDEKIRLMKEKSLKRVGQLSSELIKAKPKDKELILAEMQTQRWIIDTTDECID